MMLQLICFLLVAAYCHAEKDSNVYPWGTNPNNHFRMYWKDAANVIQDLSNFQALYITVHGCVWSECGVDDFDDDGENHDGDEDWYQTRTSTFCANAAFSLYGIKKNNFKLVNTCSKGTYINSFFTYTGADLIPKALGMSVNTNDGNLYTGADDDYSTSNSDCVAYNGRQRRDRRLSGSQDNNNNEGDAEDYVSGQVVATKMGCASSATSKYNHFVLAGFEDNYCTGTHFVETLDNLKQYNKAMNKVSCKRVFDLSSYNRNQRNNNDDGNGNDDLYNDDGMNGDNNNRRLDEGDEDEMEEMPLWLPLEYEPDVEHLWDDMSMVNEDDIFEDDDLMMDPPVDQESRQLNENNNNNNNYNSKRTFGSVAEEILYQSWACDLSLYPTQCPDPYGLKRKYYNVLKAAANGQPVSIAVMNAKLRKPIKFFTWVLFLSGFYLLGFAYFLKNRDYIKANGGGYRGLLATFKRDTIASAEYLAAKIRLARERQRRKQRGAASGDDDEEGGNAKKMGAAAVAASMFSNFFGGKSTKKKKRRSKKIQRSNSKTIPPPRQPSSTRGISYPTTNDYTEDSETHYTEMSEGEEETGSSDYQSKRSRRSSRSKQDRRRSSSGQAGANYSSNRTSRAAEAAFAAAAQYDLEQQHRPSSRRSSKKEGDGLILHPPPMEPRSSSNRKSARGRGSAKSNPRPSRSSSGRRRSESQSHSQRSSSIPPQSGRRSSRRGMVDPSPTRSPGGSSIRKSKRRTRRHNSTGSNHADSDVERAVFV